jgi:hypothetical protein
MPNGVIARCHCIANNNDYGDDDDDDDDDDDKYPELYVNCSWGMHVADKSDGEWRIKLETHE